MVLKNAEDYYLQLCQTDSPTTQEPESVCSTTIDNEYNAYESSICSLIIHSTTVMDRRRIKAPSKPTETPAPDRNGTKKVANTSMFQPGLPVSLLYSTFHVGSAVIHNDSNLDANIKQDKRGTTGHRLTFI